jgi:cytochrome c5
MLKRLMFIAAALAVGLTACQPAPAARPATAVPTARATPRPTERAAASVPPASDEVIVGSNCTVVTRRGLPTAVSPFPAISAKDWKLGPEGARVTILEYSDFM